MNFICYPKCTTCQKAQKWLDEKGVIYQLRDIKLEKPNVAELSAWLKKSGLPLKRFFNTSGLLYKSLNMKEKVATLSEKELIDIIASDGMLVKRPLLVAENFVLVGFKEDEWAKMV